MRQERPQQAELGGGEDDLVTAPSGDASIEVQLEPAVRMRFGLAAAEGPSLTGPVGVARLRTAFTRATSSRGLNGLVT